MSTSSMTSAHDTYSKTTRFGCLDGLRALAVLAVVWHHSPAGRGISGWPASWRGYLGVDLFFVISGFLITTLLLRERDRRGQVAVGAFLARRALRLFPLYYLLLASFAIYLGVLAPDAPMAGAFFQDLPYYATYTSNWIHASTFLVLTWSLAAEEQFYLLWAPALRVLGDQARLLAWFTLAAGLAVTFAPADELFARLFGANFRELDMVQATFNPIALGCLAAWWLHSPRGHERALALLGSRLAAPAAALAVVLAASVPEPEPLRYGRPVVQLFMTGLVVSVVLRERNGLASILRIRPLVHLGSVSYGVYLLHMVTLQGVRPLAEEAGLHPTALFGLNAGAAWLAASVSYSLLERPFLGLKERFRPA